MFVSDKYKILFVHIPKTGGSAIRQMMFRGDQNCYKYNGHHPVMTKADAVRFKDYYKFAVVRNSYRLCASVYRYMTEKIGGLQPSSSNLRELKRNAKFLKPNGMLEFFKFYNNIENTEKSIDWNIERIEETFTHVLKNDPFPVQLDYISEKGEILVDKIFFFEEGLDKVELSLKKQTNFSGYLLDKNHPANNYHGEYDWRAHYDPQTIEYVRQTCQKDIEYFGFKYH